MNILFAVAASLMAMIFLLAAFLMAIFASWAAKLDYQEQKAKWPTERQLSTTTILAAIACLFCALGFSGTALLFVRAHSIAAAFSAVVLINKVGFATTVAMMFIISGRLLLPLRNLPQSQNKKG